MARPREIELKLDIEPSDVARLRKLPVLAKAPGGSSRRLTSVYFDTPKHALAKHGLTLRVREVDGRFLQTIKAEQGSACGLFDRPEWEWEIERPEPDLTGVEDTALGDLMREHDLANELAPVFETRVDRHSWTLRRGGAEIEFAIDVGEVRAGAQKLPISEIEMEVTSGSHRALFALARTCNAAVPLHLGVESKSERGYRLLEGRLEGPVKSESIDLHRDMRVREGFQAIVYACIRHFRRNEALVSELRDVEGLHQVRVAMRRLRSSFSLFRDVIADPTLPRLRSSLQIASQQFGEARNLDIFIENCARDPNLADPHIVEKARAAREEAYDHVVATLTSQAFRELMFDLVAWTQYGPWLSTHAPEQRHLREERLATFAVETLDFWRRKVRKKGQALETMDEAERHRVRIATKKLRYASEFFAPLFSSKEARQERKHFIEALQELQESLGHLNDLAASREIALYLSGQRPVPPPVVDDEETIVEVSPPSSPPPPELLAAAVDAYRKFVEAEPFWR